MLASVLAGPDATARIPGLTKREREVLRLLADGMRNEDAARELSISPLTIRTHIEKAMAKLEADTRTQAVANRAAHVADRLMDREVVHDLNNALLPIRAYAELALRKVERGEDPRVDLEELLAAVDRATELARSLRSKQD